MINPHEQARRDERDANHINIHSRPPSPKRQKYGLLMQQNGDGCDHTIGCGLRVEWFEATNRKHAVSYARRFLQGREAEDVEDGEGESDDCWLFDERGGPALAWARLIEGVLELPIVDWRTDIVHARADAKHRAATSAQATAEKAELRRLLAKYGTV